MEKTGGKREKKREQERKREKRENIFLQFRKSLIHVVVGCDRSSKPSRAPLRLHGWPAPPPRSRRSRRLASATLGPSPLPAKQRGTNEYILQSPDAAKFLEEWYLKIFGLLITGSLVFRATSDFGFPSNFASAKEISVHRLLLVQPVFFFDVE